MYLDQLKRISPFNILEDLLLQAVNPDLQMVVYPKDSVVFKQKEPSKRRLFLIVKGLAEIVITTESGSENIVGIRKENEFFGETVLLTDKPYPASVRAVEELHCLLLSKEDFEILLERSPLFAGYFSRILSERLRLLFKEAVLEQSYEAYGLDSQPFRKRVANIMSSPVVACRTNDCISTVAKIMKDKLVSSTVVLDEQDKPVGLITETDLVTKVLTGFPGACSDIPLLALDVMNSNLIMLPPDAFFYQALLSMIKESVKHVIIADESKVIGIVTVRDLVRSRSTGALTIVSQIESQTTIEGLAEASKDVIQVLQALVAEKASAQEIFEVMTQFYDRITKKVIEISEAEMEKEGYGTPPVEYCWLTMGSGGRKEQFLQTDQDNAIIYENYNDRSREVVDYFNLLASKIVKGLVDCGFEKCKGDIMASNPKWCRSLDSWVKLFSTWIGELHPENIRMLTIFLDFRPVYGKISLAQSLRSSIQTKLNHAPIALYQLAKDDLDHKVPISWFNQFILEKKGPHKNEIDLKRSVCIHVVDCVRLFALLEGLNETNTITRLQQLTELEVIPKDDAEFIDAAYQSLMMFRIRENLKKLMLGLEADNYINPSKLSKRERLVLKEAIVATSRLQAFTGATFRIQ